MQRVRRVASIAAIAVLGVVALTGCRQDPRVAAYVGGTQYTTKQVQEILKQADKVGGQAADQSDVFCGDPEKAVGCLVYLDVLKKLFADRGWPTPDPATDLVVRSYGISPDGSYAKLVAEWYAYQNALLSLTREILPANADFSQPAPRPSDADLAILYAGQYNGDKPTKQQLDEFWPADTEIQWTLKLIIDKRNLVLDTIRHMHITVNPRYSGATGAIYIQPQTGAALVQVPLGDPNV